MAFLNAKKVVTAPLIGAVAEDSKAKGPKGFPMSPIASDYQYQALNEVNNQSQ